METKQVVSIRLYPSTIAEIEKCGCIKQEFIEAAIKEKLEKESKVVVVKVGISAESIKSMAGKLNEQYPKEVSMKEWRKG